MQVCGNVYNGNEFDDLPRVNFARVCTCEVFTHWQTEKRIGPFLIVTKYRFAGIRDFGSEEWNDPDKMKWYMTEVSTTHSLQ